MLNGTGISINPMAHLEKSLCAFFVAGWVLPPKDNKEPYRSTYPATTVYRAQGFSSFAPASHRY
jgi:hypothetical protein